MNDILHISLIMDQIVAESCNFRAWLACRSMASASLRPPSRTPMELARCLVAGWSERGGASEALMRVCAFPVGRPSAWLRVSGRPMPMDELAAASLLSELAVYVLNILDSASQPPSDNVMLTAMYVAARNGNSGVLAALFGWQKLKHVDGVAAWRSPQMMLIFKTAVDSGSLLAAKVVLDDMYTSLFRTARFPEVATQQVIEPINVDEQVDEQGGGQPENDEETTADAQRLIIRSCAYAILASAKHSRAMLDAVVADIRYHVPQQCARTCLLVSGDCATNITDAGILRNLIEGGYLQIGPFTVINSIMNASVACLRMVLSMPGVELMPVPPSILKASLMDTAYNGDVDRVDALLGFWARMNVHDMQRAARAVASWLQTAGSRSANSSVIEVLERYAPRPTPLRITRSATAAAAAAAAANRVQTRSRAAASDSKRPRIKE